jgi:hypothetical protein
MNIAFLHTNIIGIIETQKIVKQCEFHLENDSVNQLKWLIT